VRTDVAAFDDPRFEPERLRAAGEGPQSAAPLARGYGVVVDNAKLSVLL
jgi:hypothetical protein